MRKPQSIRSKITTTLVAPVVALTGLWFLTLSQTVNAARCLRSTAAAGQYVGRSSDVLVAALQAERSRSVDHLATGRGDAGGLHTQRVATDTTVGDFRRLTGQYSASGAGNAATRASIKHALVSLSRLTSIRAAVDAGATLRTTALANYSALISDALQVLYAATAVSASAVDRQIHTLVSLNQSRELFSQEDALLTGAIAAGAMNSGEYLELIKIVDVRRFQTMNASAELPAPARAVYVHILASPAFAAVRATEDTIIERGPAGGPVPVRADAWRSAYDAASTPLHHFLTTQLDGALKQAQASGTETLEQTSAVAMLGLLGVILSVLTSVRNGRAMVGRLTALRSAATNLAEHRLPEVVARLRAGEQVGANGVDADHWARDLPAGVDEITEVGAAFTKVQRSAIDSAVAEATLRRGMNKVFVNISRRSQCLISRQLTLLEQMYTTAATPDHRRYIILADRLAVRMRRHAEDLVILAGDAPSRGWHSRVPLAEVIRSAVAEVEDCDRIEIQTIADVALPGKVIPDVVHLLAALLENATAFSPPTTPVHVIAQRVATGIGVEIEDRGLGMTSEARAEANARLSAPPVFNPANSTRLGLFVVAQLAARRGLRVSLRPSSYGGVTAMVLIPTDLIEQTSTPDQVPGANPVVDSQPPGMAAKHVPTTARHGLASNVNARWRFPQPTAAAAPTTRPRRLPPR